MRALKRGASLLVPGGAILAVVLAIQTLSPSVAEGARYFYLAGVSGLALFLTWRFQRTRLVVSFVLLAAEYLIILRPDLLDAGGGARTVATMLVPVNLVVYNLIPERGLLGPRGLPRLLILILQGVVVLLLANPPIPTWTQMAVDWLEAAAPATALPFGGAAVYWAGMAGCSIAYLLRPNASARSLLWALVAMFSAYYRPEHALLNLSTALLILELGTVESSYFMAYRDSLTGLPGRRALNEAMLRLGGQFAIAMVDVDHFKRFNDNHGHDVGDQVLRSVAAQLAAVGRGGRAYRYGGEEFAIVFPGKTVDDVKEELDALRDRVAGHEFVVRSRSRPRRKPAKPRRCSGARSSIALTVSIGASDSSESSDPQEVLDGADRALYRAKSSGRNRVSVTLGKA